MSPTLAARARAVLPWAVGLATIAALLAGVDAGATLDALARADLARFAPRAALFVALALALDARVLASLFSASLGIRIPWTRMLRWRAASYAFLGLSFHLSSAALLGQLRREARASWPELGGAMAVHYAGDLAVLVGIASLGALAVGAGKTLGPALAVAGLAAGVAIAGLLWAARSRLVARGGAPRFIRALQRLSARDGLQLLLGRAAWYAGVVAFTASTLPCFGIHVAPGELVARMPIVLALAALPISPAGLGTTQAAMVGLLGGLADPAALLAYALAYTAVLLARIPLGALVWVCTRPRGGEAAAQDAAAPSRTDAQEGLAP